MKSHVRLGYQEQGCRLTLAEGLEEYYAANLGIVARPDSLPSQSALLFRAHDICHVVFGLNTALQDEVLADARTLLACDVGFLRYAGYLKANPEVQAIFRKEGYLRSAGATVLAIPRILRAAKAAWTMPHKWPWQPPEAFLKRSLFELRIEFGIDVL